MIGPLIEVQGLVKRFTRGARSILAVDDVSFRIGPGETFGLVGESGCGKSTLALCMLALEQADAGRVLFAGKEMLGVRGAELRTLRRNARMLFQNPEAVFNSGMTIGQALDEELEKEQGLSRDERRKRAEETLGRCGLGPEVLRRYPAGLSTGEKQRASIARAIITNPRFIICDEAVASLDLGLKLTITDLLTELQQQLGLSYLFISHSLSLTRRMSHTIGVMYMGNLVEEAPAARFTADQVLHPYSKLLFTSSPGLEKGRYLHILRHYPDAEPTWLVGGCPFRHRCPLFLKHRDPRCETERPGLREVKAGRKVACHRAEETGSIGAEIDNEKGA